MDEALHVGEEVGGHVPPGPLERVHSRWVDCCAADSLPNRQDFRPEAIVSVLPQVFLIDVEGEASRRYRYRLIGTRIAEWSGGDATGRALDDPSCGPNRWAFISLVDRTVEARCPTMTLARPTLFGGSAFLFDRLMVPLASDGSSVDMVLGVANLRRRQAPD